MENFHLRIKKLYQILAVIAGSILIAAVSVSVYLIFFANSLTSLPAGTSPAPQQPTPTPFYLGLLSQPANYVGPVEEINGTESITIKRRDGSQAVLNFKPNIPIYEITDTSTNPPQIYIRNVSSLVIGQILTVYTQGDEIVAIFTSKQ